MMSPVFNDGAAAPASVTPGQGSQAAGQAGEVAELYRGLVRIDCPPETFDLDDGEEAYIMRRRRCAVWRLDAIRATNNREEICANLAAMIPRWAGVRDCETGELLPDPIEDPAVFERIDAFEQLPWLAEQLRVDPTKKAPAPGRGQI